MSTVEKSVWQETDRSTFNSLVCITHLPGGMHCVCMCVCENLVGWKVVKTISTSLKVATTNDKTAVWEGGKKEGGVVVVDEKDRKHMHA